MIAVAQPGQQRLQQQQEERRRGGDPVPGPGSGAGGQLGEFLDGAAGRTFQGAQSAVAAGCCMASKQHCVQQRSSGSYAVGPQQVPWHGLSMAIQYATGTAVQRVDIINQSATAGRAPNGILPSSGCACISALCFCARVCTTAPGGDSAEIPAIVARRGNGPFGKDGSRKISMHVDDFEMKQQRRAHKLGSPPGTHTKAERTRSVCIGPTPPLGGVGF